MSLRKLKLVTLSEVKEILQSELELREEPINEQKYAKEHADRFGKIKGEEAVSLIEELMELNPKVKEHLAYKLADFLPDHPDGVRVVFSRERFTLTEEEINEILKVISKYRPED